MPKSLVTEKICHEVFLCAPGSSVFSASLRSAAEFADFLRAAAQMSSRFSAHHRRRPKFCANFELRYTEAFGIGHRHAGLRGMRRAHFGVFRLARRF